VEAGKGSLGEVEAALIGEGHDPGAVIIGDWRLLRRQTGVRFNTKLTKDTKITKGRYATANPLGRFSKLSARQARLGVLCDLGALGVQIGPFVPFVWFVDNSAVRLGPWRLPG